MADGDLTLREKMSSRIRDAEDLKAKLDIPFYGAWTWEPFRGLRRILSTIIWGILGDLFEYASEALDLGWQSLYEALRS